MASLAASKEASNNVGDSAGVRACSICYNKWRRETGPHEPFPQVEKEKWSLDKDHAFCEISGHEFTVFRRRHHCRFCGKCICSECSKFITTKVGDTRFGVLQLGAAAATSAGVATAVLGAKEFMKIAPLIGDAVDAAGSQGKRFLHVYGGSAVRTV